MYSSPWLLSAGAGRPLRLYCFCFAGGNAATYLDWKSALAPDIEIRAFQLPGRGARFFEAPATGFNTLIATLSDVLRNEPADRPFAFFGHSLGALLAFELARTQAARALPLPAHLILSGCAAPRYRPAPKGAHLLNDAALIQHLRDLNGTPHEILEQEELMAMLLPTIRADMALVADYVYCSGVPLRMPLTVMAGRDDDISANQQTAGWSEETLGPCEIRWYDGDHFFINSQRETILSEIKALLMPLLQQSDA